MSETTLREAVEALAEEYRVKNGDHWCEWGCDVVIGSRLREVLAAPPPAVPDAP